MTLAQNLENGRLAELCSRCDKLEQGFSIIAKGGHGWDYLCAKITESGILAYWVECKFNKSPLSKTQKKFRALCKRMNLNFLVDRISPEQLQYWLDQRGAI